MIYHFKSNANFNNSKRNDIEFILFLNRMFNEIEIRYWFIEFEMIDLIWIVRKVRHMIKTIKTTIVVFIDHAVNTFIIKQIILINSNTNKFNFRLMRTFIYLSQFRLDVKYRSKKIMLYQTFFFVCRLTMNQLSYVVTVLMIIWIWIFISSTYLTF